eukprot:5588281-Amphidinium_carterae.1
MADVEQLAQELALLRQELQQHLRVQQSQTRDRLLSLVDTKGIGKPATFFGKEDEWSLWRVWSAKFESFVVGVYNETEITEADVNQRFGTAAPAADQVEDVRQKGGQ